MNEHEKVAASAEAETPHEAAVLTVPTAERVCPHCGRTIAPDDATEEWDGDVWHEGCLDVVCPECCECGERHPREDLHETVDGLYVCESCADADYVACEDCGLYVREARSRRIGDKTFCRDCAERWRECEDCGRVVSDDDSYCTESGRTICERCYRSDYFICTCCDEIYHVDDGRECSDGEWRCDDCADEYEREREPDTTDVMGYHEFPRGNYRVRRCEDESFVQPMLAFGVELECDHGVFDASDFGRWIDDDCLVHFERDGSLSKDGVELVTQPCTLRFHQREMDWWKLLSRLRRQGFESHNVMNENNRSRCGLHVHISRAALRPTTILKMDAFVNHAKGFFAQVARRRTFFGTDYDEHKKMCKGKLLEYGHDARYTAVNTTNPDTVELRIFRGSLKRETVLGTIELCHALVGFLDGVPIPRVYDTEANVLKFVDYVGERAADYPDAIPMLARLVKAGPCVPNVRCWMGALSRKEAECLAEEV